MAVPPNPLSALIDFLRADTDVAAEAGTKVFGAELPDTEIGSMPQKCVVITASGGAPSGSTLRMGQPRFDVKCYGSTPTTAWDVYLAVHQALKQMSRNQQGTCVLNTALVVAGPVQLRDADAQWPLVFGVYEITAAELAPT